MPRHQNHFPTGLDSLLQQNAQAKAYFQALPSYAQDLVRRNQENIQTEAELERYASHIIDGLTR